MRIKTLLLVIAFIISGCTTTGGTRSSFQLATPLPDKATIYHYRVNNFFGGGIHYKVLANDAPLTTIGNGGYYKQIIKPGHVVYKRKDYRPSPGYFLILSNSINNALSNLEGYQKEYELDVKAGEVYFIRWGVTDESFGTQEIPYNQAISEIQELKNFKQLTMSDK